MTRLTQRLPKGPPNSDSLQDQKRVAALSNFPHSLTGRLLQKKKKKRALRALGHPLNVQLFLPYKYKAMLHLRLQTGPGLGEKLVYNETQFQVK